MIKSLYDLSRRGAAAALIIILPCVVHADPNADYEKGAKAYGEDDLITGLMYLEKASQAGHADAQRLLGYIYNKAGQNDRAKELYLQSYESGNAKAAYALGAMYAAGDGVPKDYEQALGWFKKSADSGYGVAMETLGVAYLEGGLGLNKDEARARELLQQAVDSGHEPARRVLESLDAKKTTVNEKQ